MSGATSSTEVERTYDVGPQLPLPDLAGPADWSVRPPERFALDATYVDTAELHLRAARTVLRRRTGGHDAGWHLERPSGGDRQELHLPLSEQVPEQLAELVAVHAQGRPLEPVAHLATDRTVRVLCDASGAPVAEVADDLVRARRLPDGEALRWRKWEVELLGDDRTVLDRVEAVLLAAGARLSAAGSKSGRVLDRPSCGRTPATAPAAPSPGGAAQR